MPGYTGEHMLHPGGTPGNHWKFVEHVAVRMRCQCGRNRLRVCRFALVPQLQVVAIIFRETLSRKPLSKDPFADQSSQGIRREYTQGVLLLCITASQLNFLA